VWKKIGKNTITKMNEVLITNETIQHEERLKKQIGEGEGG
jgi:hypothetical protein